MDDTKITRQRDGRLNGRHQNNSPKRWTDGELNGWQKNNLPRDG